MISIDHQTIYKYDWFRMYIDNNIFSKLIPSFIASINSCVSRCGEALISSVKICCNACGKVDWQIDFFTDFDLLHSCCSAFKHSAICCGFTLVGSHTTAVKELMIPPDLRFSITDSVFASSPSNIIFSMSFVMA